MPTVRVEVENVDCPLAFRLVPVPSVVDPSLNVTAPVAALPPTVLGETVAVKVTDWPKTDGLELDVSEVVVVAWTVKIADVVWTLVAETLCAPAVAPAGTLKEQAP